MSLQFQKSTLISILVATAFFMENLDGTVIATALPQMGKSFHVNPVDLNIGMTAYLLMLAVFIPISGWVADRIGARSVFVTAIAIFTVSSDSLRIEQWNYGVYLGAHRSRDRRRDDGSRWAAGGTAHNGKAQADGGDRLHHLAGAGRACGGASRRRLHHHVFYVALDLLSQCAARDHRHGALAFCGFRICAKTK